jgi:hypothetical protein
MPQSPDMTTTQGSIDSTTAEPADITTPEGGTTTPDLLETTTSEVGTSTSEQPETTTFKTGMMTQDLMETTTPETGTTTPYFVETATPDVQTTPEPMETTTPENETTPTDVAIPTLIPPGGCRVFVSSSKYKGNLGGYEGADAECQMLANSDASEVEGDYKAWISTTVYSPSANFTDCANGYYLVTGEKIADNLADLTSTNSLEVPINVDEKAFVYSNVLYVWTGTNDDGTPAGNRVDGRCKDWTTSQNGLDGNLQSKRGFGGKTNEVDQDWTKTGKAGCGNTKRIYCFEQPLTEPEQTTTPEIEPVNTTPNPEATSTTGDIGAGECLTRCTVTRTLGIETNGAGQIASVDLNLENVLSLDSVTIEVAHTWGHELEISLTPPDGSGPYFLMNDEPDGVAEIDGGNAVPFDMGIVVGNGFLGNVAPYTFVESGGTGVWPGGNVLAPANQAYDAREWPTGSYDAGDWTLLIFDEEAVDYLSIGDLSITYCFDGDICPDFTVTTPVPETPEPETCADPATLSTPSALGFCGEDISVRGELSPISRFYSFEAALNLTKASDLEIVILTPDGVFYTVVSGEGGDAQMGDEFGDPVTYTFASTGVPFGSALLGTGFDGDPFRIDPAPVYQAYEWPRPQDTGDWEFVFSDIEGVNEMCFDSFSIEVCLAGSSSMSASDASGASNTIAISKDTSTIEEKLSLKREHAQTKKAELEDQQVRN